MKIQKYLILLLLIIFCSISTFAQTVDDNSDIVGWSDVTFIIPLKKKDEGGKRVDQWTLNLGGVLRFGRNLKRPIDERGVVNLNYRINKYFTVGSGYLYRRFRPTEARRQFEHRLMFYLLAEKKWTNVTLKNRAMTTYFIKNSRPDTVAFRNRAQLNFPIKKTTRNCSRRLWQMSLFTISEKRNGFGTISSRAFQNNSRQNSARIFIICIKISISERFARQTVSA